MPTIASTDAPCSALSVIYSDEGVFEKYLFLPANPNMVLVDTTIVAAAPVRLLVAGMGDALATYFEARACEASGATNCVGGKTTLAAMGLARLCYDTLLEDGVKAKLAVENGVCTKAVEHVIEANTYLSGLGFESGGLAAGTCWGMALPGTWRWPCCRLFCSRPCGGAGPGRAGARWGLFGCFCCPTRFTW